MIKDKLKEILTKEEYKILELVLKKEAETELAEEALEWQATYNGWCEYDPKTKDFKF